MNIEQTYLVENHPQAVALTLPTTWHLKDEDLCGKELLTQEDIAIARSLISEKEQEEFDRSPFYCTKKILRISKAKTFLKEARSNGILPSSESSLLYPNIGSHLILESVGQGERSNYLINVLAEQYGFTEVISYPCYMYDTLAFRRLTDKFVLGITSSDQGWGEGAYAIRLGYSYLPVVLAWEFDDPYLSIQN